MVGEGACIAEMHAWQGGGGCAWLGGGVHGGGHVWQGGMHGGMGMCGGGVHATADTVLSLGYVYFNRKNNRGIWFA